MRRLNFGSAFAATIVLTAIAATADNPTPSTQPDQALTWTPITGVEHQIYPSAIISTATSNLPYGYLAIKLTNVPDRSKIHMAVKCESFMDPSSTDIVTSKEDPTPLIRLKPSWKYDQLARVRQQIPTNFLYSLTINGQEVGEKTDIVAVHSVNDCIYAVRNDSGGLQPRPGLFAAYVNEDHPKIDQLLKDALAKGIVKDWDGYQANDSNDVFRQVFAVWHTLQARGIKYSSITDVPDKSALVLAQHVRFLDESVDNAQANCVDGSIIFASVLQKIGIESALVIKPGHMFLRFYAAPNFKEPIELETTLLGARALTTDARGRLLLGTLPPAWRITPSAVSFAAAVRTGNQEFADIVAAAERAKENNSDEFVGTVVNISDARKAGIMPIPADYSKLASDEASPPKNDTH